jgi:hypothetical protein
LTVDDAERVEKAPVDGDVAPIDVPLIVPPVAVKVPAVIEFAAFESVNAVADVAPLPVTVANVSASVAVKVKALPSETLPPPVNIPAEFIVNDELARFAFVIPALPDKLALVKPVIVLLPAAIVAPVKVPPTFNVVVELFQVKLLLPEMVDELFQKVT